jgi:hypothetical protein
MFTLNATSVHSIQLAKSTVHSMQLTSQIYISFAKRSAQAGEWIVKRLSHVAVSGVNAQRALLNILAANCELIHL